MAFDPKEARALVERLDGYTPGPWTFETESGDWPDQALIGGDGDPVLEWDFDLGFSVTNTNAALIAAAPDLHRHLTAALAEIERLRGAGERAEAMLIRIGASLPSSVIQKLPLTLLMEWEAVEISVRAALKGATND